MKALTQGVHSSLITDWTSAEQHREGWKAPESSTVLVQLIPLPAGGAGSSTTAAPLLRLLLLFHVA